MYIIFIIEIDSVTPQTGSTVGGTLITINGQYFYDDINVPSQIEIGGQPCNLISFDMKNLPNTTLVCQNSPKPNSTKNEYYGNRGINLYRDNVYRDLNNLASGPASNATLNITNQLAYIGSKSVDETIWLIGFIYPKTTSLYEFSIVTNGNAVLYISTDASSANKVPFFFY